MKINKKRGFTLFELLVSISIIGILTALGVVSFSAAQQKARNVRRKEDMEAIKKAAEIYYGTAGTLKYPTDNSVANWVVNGTSLLQTFPKDPKSGLLYEYSSGVGSTGYCACAAVENSGGNSDDNTCGFTTTNPIYYCVKNQQ